MRDMTLAEWRTYAEDCGWEDAQTWTDEETADFAQREQEAEAEMQTEEWQADRDRRIGR